MLKTKLLSSLVSIIIPGCILYQHASKETTGGANGIGAATIKRLHTSGAKIIFGDFDEKAGSALVKELNTDIDYLKTDVANYADNLALFKLALKKYGKIDHAVAVAGVGERGSWFDRDLTIEDVEKPETNMTVEVNLLGVLYFVRIALPYLKVGRKEGDDKGIVLVGSAAGFRESPGLPVYQVRSPPLWKYTSGTERRLMMKSVNKTWRTRNNPVSAQIIVRERPNPHKRRLPWLDRIEHDRWHFPSIL
jgi:NADP-dependent 3-hydroxy acid dehydrogenase YdfG